MQFLGKMLTMYPNESKVQDVTDSMSLTLRAWVFSFYFIGCIFMLYPSNYYNVLTTLGFFFVCLNMIMQVLFIIIVIIFHFKQTI